jgi:hypothetical protein
LASVAGAALLSGDFAIAQTGAASNAQTAFASPEKGFLALEQAVERYDVKALREILGPGSEDLLSSGDPVDDQDARTRFVAAYKTKTKITRVTADVALLAVGEDAWPLAIPMRKVTDGWRFDSDAGRDELINRRIGRNERNTIQACLAFVDAEREYASVDHNGDGVLEYAQRFISTPGTQDGLYWPATDGKEASPLGVAFAQASAAGYQLPLAPSEAADKGSVLYGYKYQILLSQGPAAPDGAYDYVINGKMIGGFALVAYPANYGVSGIMTFIVNHDGQVYEKDLGPDTETLAPAMRRYHPDRTWKRN